MDDDQVGSGDAGVCPVCGRENEPAPNSAERLHGRTFSVCPVHGINEEGLRLDQLELREQCWREFWIKVAHIWADLPREVQEEYARRYPPADSGDARAGMDPLEPEPADAPASADEDQLGATLTTSEVRDLLSVAGATDVDELIALMVEYRDQAGRRG